MVDGFSLDSTIGCCWVSRFDCRLDPNGLRRALAFRKNFFRWVGGVGQPVDIHINLHSIFHVVHRLWEYYTYFVPLPGTLVVTREESEVFPSVDIFLHRVCPDENENNRYIKF